MNRAGNLLLATLLAWLAAQCVLQLWHGIAQPIALNPPAAPVADLLSNHWTPRQAPSDDLPLTTLKVDYLAASRPRRCAPRYWSCAISNKNAR